MCMCVYIKYLPRCTEIIALLPQFLSHFLSAIAPLAGARHGERCRRKKKEASWRKGGCGEGDAGPRTKTISRRHVHAVKKGSRGFAASVAARPGKSGTGCRDTDLTNHKGRTYTCIMATHSSIQGCAAEQRRKLVRFVMLINWLTFPSYYCTANRKLLSREALEKRAPLLCALEAIATGRRFWMDKVNDLKKRADASVDSFRGQIQNWDCEITVR